MKLNVLKENIASLEFTDENFLIVKAQILKANHGMIYFDENGNKPIVESILSEDLFTEKSMKSFIGKTVTIDHPVERLNTKNLTKFKKGTIIEVEKNNDFLTATLQIEEKDTIDYLVEMYHNKTPIEVSAGYFATTEKIDSGNFIQKSIKGNHLAILPVGLKGRAGSEVKLIYNKSGGVRMSEQKYVTNQGEMTAEELVTKVNELQTVSADMELKVNVLETEKAVSETEIASLTTKLNSITVENTELVEKINALEVENNMKELKEKVNSFIEVKEEMTAREIKENVILKVNKNFDSTGKSDEAINATFDFAVETLQGMAQTETALDLVENSVKEAVKEESVIVTDFTKYRNYGGKN